MAKISFIMGINTANLKYCSNDAALMRECLEKLDYKSIVFQEKQDKWKILPKFAEMIENCSDEDTLIFYFSGHGKAEGGFFYLITEEDSGRESNRIRACEFIEPLEVCKAKK